MPEDQVTRFKLYKWGFGSFGAFDTVSELCEFAGLDEAEVERELPCGNVTDEDGNEWKVESFLDYA